VDIRYYHSHPACTQQEAGISNGSVRTGQAVTGPRLCSHVAASCGRYSTSELWREAFDYSRPATPRRPLLNRQSSAGSTTTTTRPIDETWSLCYSCCALAIDSSLAPSYSSTLHSTSLSPSPNYTSTPPPLARLQTPTHLQSIQVRPQHVTNCGFVLLSLLALSLRRTSYRARMVHRWTIA
jgi:hypothetical protein